MSVLVFSFTHSFSRLLCRKMCLSLPPCFYVDQQSIFHLRELFADARKQKYGGVKNRNFLSCLAKHERQKNNDEQGISLMDLQWKIQSFSAVSSDSRCTVHILPSHVVCWKHIPSPNISRPSCFWQSLVVPSRPMCVYMQDLALRKSLYETPNHDGRQNKAPSIQLRVSHLRIYSLFNAVNDWFQFILVFVYKQYYEKLPKG